MRFSSAYTLVELLIALALSLLLLLAVAEMFQRVGGTMRETRSAMSAAAQLNEAAMMLRQDLTRIPKTLATKPEHIKKLSNLESENRGAEISDLDGYLEIIEGPYTTMSHPYVDENGEHDWTVGDVDDIIAFTLVDAARPFRGLILNEGRLGIEERKAAEIVWFVRGNTLYRRQRLLNDLDPVRVGTRDDQGPFTSTVKALARREYRILHAFFGEPGASVVNHFPYPLYNPENYDPENYAPGNLDWYHLRVPLLEETLHQRWQESAGQWKTVPIHGIPAPLPDLWERPHAFPDWQDGTSGALKEYCNLYNHLDNDPPAIDGSPAPRHPRAGEDVVLTNVLSFDIKVWCRETKDFVDLGTGQWNDQRTYDGITLHGNGGYVWDSWTPEYYEDYGDLPPYGTPLALEAVRITIRCFDPVSRTIRQVTVVQRF